MEFDLYELSHACTSDMDTLIHKYHREHDYYIDREQYSVNKLEKYLSRIPPQFIGLLCDMNDSFKQLYHSVKSQYH